MISPATHLRSIIQGLGAKALLALAAVALPALVIAGLLGATLITAAGQAERGFDEANTAARHLANLRVLVESEHGLIARVPAELDLEKVNRFAAQITFDKIKIDRSFVSDLSSANVDALAVVRSVARLGVTLGMATTAEGVETREQMDKVRAEGCTEMQGFYVCAPAPAEEITRLLRTSARKPASAA